MFLPEDNAFTSQQKFGNSQQQDGTWDSQLSKMERQVIFGSQFQNYMNMSDSDLRPMRRKMAKPDRFKTVMCKGWLETGECSFGENCRFAHGEKELLTTHIPVNNPKYKTKLCQNYTEKGMCPYGDRCLFIHPKVLDAVGVPSNPYFNPCRLEEILRERNGIFLPELDNESHLDASIGSAQNSSFDNSPWSTQLSEVFDFAIESDNQARSLAADLYS